LHCRPFTTASRDTASIERPRNAAMGCNAGGLYLTNDRRDVPGEAISIGFQIGDSATANVTEYEADSAIELCRYICWYPTFRSTNCSHAY
jgi:hypothetical protein